ncbi:MAG: GDSL-type esterase/lipase family protein [Nitrososphaerota archaeon]|jgi:lysophospholipase L1-like esterase|nr:GDSL-type esterase/lipase family protein [Nitrososphaerota archaeon]
MLRLSRAKILIAFIVIIIVVSNVAVVLTSYITPKEVDLTRVACLGDSITEYAGYPEYLQFLLGENSTVANFGVSRSAVNLNSDNPYYYKVNFQKVINFNATTVVLILGTNDVYIDNCLKINSFINDYRYLISQIRHSTDATIFIAIPPPVFDNTLGLDGIFFVEEVIPRIQQIANKEKMSLIDLYTPLLDYPEYFPDGIHPTKEGSQIITETIYKAIKNT